MTLITTVAELEALPVDARLSDCDEDVWRKKTTERWMLTDSDPGALGLPAAAVLDLYAPLTLIWPLPMSPELVSTRCCGHDCHDTALLRPGSTYLCPDHGDCSADIRKEQTDDEH